MKMNRRHMLALSGVAAATTLFSPSVRAQAAAPFKQPELPYEGAALSPVISARTVGLHFGKHHAGYFKKLNTLTEKTPFADLTLEEVVVRAKKENETAIFNNAAQAWNHNFYWQQFKGGPAAAEGAFLDAAKSSFGGIDELQKQIVAESDKVFGTGWVWLVKDGDKLVVVGMQDAGNPLADGKKTLLGVDVWEHAYYLDYENRRTEHVAAVLGKLVNWTFVAEKFQAA
ncbi:superoxide dismutase [Phyllobacterium sp. YR531]|uniref:superoxide dismutase n=1 Tax=Phyllobacterium sp. YR531 TaxID=1144343 RepID=UPI00026F751E|nr:superoxide dismutase [Phyllobacterium sp. YR531]EJN05196.1 superoxide dismutase [Phyllobacterium sp. YR531]